jgi:RNA polymerase sigma-70 factor (ECF subfamily)
MVEEELDAILADQAVHGDLDAFGRLIGRYQRQVFAIVFRMIGNYEDARDLSQQVFLKAFEHLSSFDRERKFFSWIYRIAMNEAINHLKARRQYDTLDPDRPAPGLSVVERLETEDRNGDVHEAVLSLDEKHRSVVVLRHFAHCSYREAADLLEIPEQTVKSRLFEARQILRQKLMAKGYTG